MPSLAERQSDFSAAVLDPARRAPLGLVGPGSKPSERRFAVYRNNVAAGLIATLKDAFPVVRRVVGDEFFRAMARDYVLSHPPRSPIMLEYGAGFPAFISGFEPAAVLPYLPDVAYIEQAWREAYHAVEATPLGSSAFAEIAPERLSDICLRLHPSARVVRSPLPALTIWRMNVGEAVPAFVDLAGGGEDTLIVRPGAEVEVRLMPAGGAEFLCALSAEKSMLEATRIALAADVCFDLSANLAGLIGAGVFVAHRFVDVRPHGEVDAGNEGRAPETHREHWRK